MYVLFAFMADKRWRKVIVCWGHSPVSTQQDKGSNTKQQPKKKKAQLADDKEGT